MEFDLKKKKKNFNKFNRLWLQPILVTNQVQCFLKKKKLKNKIKKKKIQIPTRQMIGFAQIVIFLILKMRPNTTRSADKIMLAITIGNDLCETFSIWSRSAKQNSLFEFRMVGKSIQYLKCSLVQIRHQNSFEIRFFIFQRFKCSYFLLICWYEERKLKDNLSKTRMFFFFGIVLFRNSKR